MTPKNFRRAVVDWLKHPGFWATLAVVAALVVGVSGHLEAGRALAVEKSAAWSLGLCVTGLVLAVQRRRGWPVTLQIITLVGLLARGLYLSETSWSVRSHDPVEHLEHVQLILANPLHPPADRVCLQCYHPHPYYYAAAGVIRLVRGLALPIPWETTLQVLSLVGGCTFLLAGLSALRHALPQGAALLAAALAFAVWPSPVVHSIRLGNEPLFHGFAALSLRSLVIWSQQGAKRPLVFGALWAAVSLAFKGNGVLVLGLAALAASWDLWAGFAWRLSIRKKRASLAALCIAMGGLCISPLRSFFGERGALAFVTNSFRNVVNGLTVGIHPGNYLYFDLRSWLEHPWTNAWDDNLGRVWFLNYMGKTSLFGEFVLLDGAWGEWLADIISIAALVMVALVVLRGVFRLSPREACWGVALLLFPIALGTLRYQLSFACSNDFRYIMPVLIPFTICVGRSLGRPFTHPGARVLAWGSVLVFGLASLTLIVSMATQKYF